MEVILYTINVLVYMTFAKRGVPVISLVFRPIPIRSLSGKAQKRVYEVSSPIPSSCRVVSGGVTLYGAPSPVGF